MVLPGTFLPVTNLEKACKVNLGYNETVCDNIYSHKETQVEAQKLVSEIQVI